MLGGWGRAAWGTRSGVSVWAILFSKGPRCPLFTEALGMAPRVGDTSKGSLEFGIGNNYCVRTLLFRKARFVSNSDGPFHRCVNAGSGRPREESILSGILR